EQTDSTIIIYTAVESPTWFRNHFECVTIHDRLLSVRHNLDRTLDEMAWDDIWPIEDLAEVSNVDGAYGIFTAHQYTLEYTFVLALKP
ncbi:MAG: hypothetical protein JSU61_01800, partial [Fidelibacterota bacterium]